jgi:c-di-GMP-binding flagellar brake protein YcgR
MLETGVKDGTGGVCVSYRTAETERRKWSRLPLAIPVFVRSRDEKGREFLEFATALNISAGGMLVAVKRALALSAQVSLEIPSAPLATLAGLPRSSRNMRAKMLRMSHTEGYHLLGLKFSRPLLNHRVTPRVRERKVASEV